MDPQVLISAAIADRHLVSFVLHGLERIAEPHLLGEHAGRIQMLVYQVRGSSSSGSLPHWRRVDLSDVTELRILADSFSCARTESFPNWDRVIARVTESAVRSFGNPPNDERLQPEKWYPRDTNDQSRSVFEGYRALDERSGGGYARFLQQAARCTRCAADPEVPSGKKPIPLMCGTAGLDGTDAQAFEGAHRALDAYRRKDARNFGSLSFDPDGAGKTELTEFLDKQGLKGLAIGHCGWGDLTARIRGSQLGEGVDLMILGADWYPLTQCSNFLLDRYTEWDHTIQGFMTRLGVSKEGVADFFASRRVYLGNVLLCYRTGWDKEGDSNLSPRSFDNCRDEHLRRHIEAVAPRILVTFGRNACRSVAQTVAGETDDDKAALKKLSRKEPKLREVMTGFYRNGPQRGIATHLGEQSIAFVPLCHPCRPNHYEGDYEALKDLLNRPDDP